MKRLIYLLIVLPFIAQAQTPRLNLKQLAKDTTFGSVLISTPSDSGIVFSRDFYISYGADTVLILYGDTVGVGATLDAEQVQDIVGAMANAGLGIDITYNDTDGELLFESLSIEDSIKNETGTLIAKGTPLYATGVQGNYWTVAPADASDPTKLPVVVIAGENIADGATGLGLIKGHIKGVNTGDFTAGDEIWLASGGGYTNIEPKGGGVYSQSLGTVIKVNATDGSGIINIQEPHQTLAPDNIFIGGADSTITSFNARDTFVTISDVQTITGAKTFTSALTQSGGDVNFDSGTLYVDASANRVGIGTSSPVAKLNIDGFFNNNTYLDFLTFNDLETDGGGFTIRDATGTGDRTNPGFYFQGKGDFGGNVSYGGVFVAHIDSLATEVNGNIAWYFDARRRFKLGSTVLALTAGTTYFFGNNGTMQLEIKHNNNIFNGNNTTTFNQVSDARDKTNIQELKLGLNLIKNLNPIAYTWQSRDGKRIGIKDVGFLAQDFNAALYSLPQSDYTSLVDIDSNGNYTLNLSQMFPIYVKAIQEQQAIIESQATEIEQLKSQIQLILREIEQIKNN